MNIKFPQLTEEPFCQQDYLWMFLSLSLVGRAGVNQACQVNPSYGGGVVLDINRGYRAQSSAQFWWNLHYFTQSGPVAGWKYAPLLMERNKAVRGSNQRLDCFQFCVETLAGPGNPHLLKYTCDWWTDPQGCDVVGVFVASILLLQVVALGSLIPLADFPQLDGFIC